MMDKFEARYPGRIQDVTGFRLGNAQDKNAGTGVTVILPPAGCVGGVDVRGGAPGTRETDLLRPENQVSVVDAVVLSGGSAFGLDAATGVMRGLAQRGVGFDTGYGHVPIVPACVLFDLSVGSCEVMPDAAMGERALEDALASDVHSPLGGCIGAGCGASVGKIAGMTNAMKSGLGQAFLQEGDLQVAAVVAVNAVGDVHDPERKNEWVAGLRSPQGGKKHTEIVWPKLVAEQAAGGLSGDFAGKNTTIACVATNAKLDKAGALKVAQMAHDGFARSIYPVHTLADGDTCFVLASGKVQADISATGILAARVIARAIVNAVVLAEDAYGLPAARRKEDR